MVLSLLLTTSLLPSWSLAIILGFIAIPIVMYLYADYTAFVALGPGGTPQTVAGYMRVKVLALAALPDVYNANALSIVKPGRLHGLPDRGPRPTIRGIAPHRQITQRASQEMYARLNAEIAELSSERDDLELGVSWFEKQNTALFTRKPGRITPHGEICHAHPLDGSMHLTLHPADVKVVLDARWGERHPLARGGSFEMFVPETFVMIYAPRTEQDIEALMRIVRASVAYVGGDELEP